jgi:hypothetical protein
MLEGDEHRCAGDNWPGKIASPRFPNRWTPIAGAPSAIIGIAASRWRVCGTQAVISPMTQAPSPFFRYLTQGRTSKVCPPCLARGSTVCFNGRSKEEDAMSSTLKRNILIRSMTLIASVAFAKKWAA